MSITTTSTNHQRECVVSNVLNGEVRASVELAATPARVFRALASPEIVRWWVRPGVFDTREWTGNVRVGGRWRATGMSRGQPYAQEGEFVEIQAPRKLVHTWDSIGAPGTPSTITYILEDVDGRTRLSLRQAGFASPELGNAFAMGWQTSLERLAEILAAEHSPAHD